MSYVPSGRDHCPNRGRGDAYWGVAGAGSSWGGRSNRNCRQVGSTTRSHARDQTSTSGADLVQSHWRWNGPVLMTSRAGDEDPACSVLFFPASNATTYGITLVIAAVQCPIIDVMFQCCLKPALYGVAKTERRCQLYLNLYLGYPSPPPSYSWFPALSVSLTLHCIPHSPPPRQPLTIF